MDTPLYRCLLCTRSETHAGEWYWFDRQGYHFGPFCLLCVQDAWGATIHDLLAFIFGSYERAMWLSYLSRHHLIEQSAEEAPAYRVVESVLPLRDDTEGCPLDGYAASATAVLSIALEPL